MSGHSKWANIKRKKSANDAEKGKIFTKIGREIQVAVRQGGPDPDGNFRLKLCIQKAKANNMPADNINRSIQKAAGMGDSDVIEEFFYEGYGSGGVAILCEMMTDNRNRCASDIRYIFSRNNGNLGETGCVSYMFDRKGHIVIERSASIDEDELMMQALEAGAEDFLAQDDCFEIFTAPNDFSAVREAMEAAGYSFISAETEMLPQTTVDVSDEETAEKISRMLEMFEDNDDVQEVFHNAILPEEEEED